MYVTRSWPRLSQTFIVNEVLALERLGVDLEIFAMAASGETVRQPQVDEVRAPVICLGPAPAAGDHRFLAAREPERFAAAARFARANPDLASGYATATTSECFEHAVRIAARALRAAEAGVPVAHLHAHFAHDPALVAHLVHRLTGLPYSLTAHARDLYQIPPRSLRVRADGATSVLTCCRANLDFLGGRLGAATASRVRLIHHGVDLRRFAPGPPRPARAVVRVLSVGRLVEKKGFPDLLRACAGIAADRSFTLTVLGDGPMRTALERLRDELGLRDVVAFAGEHDSDAVALAMRDADLFALTPFVTADGDRDGLPNVVVEALASGLPVVATAAGGVGEAVRHGHNGLLAQPRDVAAIGANLAALVDDPALRRELGARARVTVEESFDVDRAARELVEVFGLGQVVP
ncbi:glycosyltransferase [Georgenia sp. SYP-B2076]|uniref:glycosyltransferase n=1 Tax=Georgenia sp. SYP-B2076 TaxID=2495881 RepID=UPI000F8E9A23|nr:glycosyltransferase [Georgenia sp. SYP-B2076]